MIGLDPLSWSADRHRSRSGPDHGDAALSYTPRPHISTALQHLRFGVTASAAALALCLAAQVVIWSLVHFTEVRVVTLAPQAVDGPLQVVRAAPTETSARDEVPAATAADASSAETSLVTSASSSEVNQVTSASDLRLRRASALTQSMGVVIALLFGALVFQGVTVAGGASAPGVEKAVTAGTWAFIIVLFVLPLASILPSLPFKGIFVSYDDMVRASDAYRTHAPGAPGWIGFFGFNLVIPVVMVIALMLVVWRFRSGIEAGVIVTNMSQLDEKLDREIRAMKLGQLAQPRALGALHSALGSAPNTEPILERPTVTAFNEQPARPQRPLGAPTAFENDPELERLADTRRRPI